MLKALFLASALAAAAASAWIASRPPRVDYYGNPRFKERGGALLLDSRLFTGIKVERFPDGSVFRETSYVRGLRDGETREWATTGARTARYRYRAGVKEGFQEGWFVEGPKRFEANYRRGILEGHQVEWHINGQVFREQEFADGVETARKVLFATSEIYSNYVKRDGRVYGLDGGALCFEAKKDGER